VYDGDVWVQLCYSVGRVPCAKLPPDSHLWQNRNCQVKHNQGLCRTHDPLALVRLAIVRMLDFDAWVQLCCSAGRVLRAQLPPDCSQVLRHWAIAELSTTEACAARTIRSLCRGLFSCVNMVHVHDSDA